MPHEAVAQQPPVLLRELPSQLVARSAPEPPLPQLESVPPPAVHEDELAGERAPVLELVAVLLEGCHLGLAPGLLPRHTDLGLEFLRGQGRQYALQLCDVDEVFDP